MTGTLRKWWMVGLLSGAVLTLGACGDDGDGGGGGDTDAGADVGTDTDGDTGGNTDTGGTDTGGTCEDPCSRNLDCADLGDDFVCEEGCCVEDGGGTGEPECDRHLQPCSSDDATTENFVCNTSAGVCMQRCADELTDEQRGGNCPLGSFCFELNFSGGAPPVDPNTGDELNGACFPGDCESDIFDENACDGVSSILDPATTCAGDTCTCLPIANNASYCITAGTAGLGEDCGLDTSDNPPASDSCGAGLICRGNVCAAPCELGDDATCDGTDAAASCIEGADCSCLEVLDTTRRNEPGVCGVACEPYSVGTCPDGTLCMPAIGRFGINAWSCVAGEPEAGPGEECTTAGSFAECPEGFICLSETEGAAPVCVQFCDPLGEATGAGASCGGGSAGPELIGATAFGEASVYLPLAAGDYDVEIRAAADGSLIAPVTVSVVEGEIGTVVAALDGEGALDLIELTDLADGETAPETGLRALHASGDAGEVDVYLGWALSGVTYGMNAGWIGVPAGETALVAAGLTATVDPAAGDAVTAVVHLDGDDAIAVTAVSIAAGDIPSTDGDAAIRFFHGADGGPGVDVYAGCPSAVACTALNQIYAGIEYGDVSTLEDYLVVDAGEADVYVFAAGDLPATDDPVFEGTIDLDADSYTTIVAYFDGRELAAGLFADEWDLGEGQFGFTAIHAISEADPADVFAESTTATLAGLVYGGTLGGADSAWASLMPGFYHITLRAGGTEDIALESGVFELAEGLTTVVVAGSATADPATLTWFAVADMLPELAEGEGAGRVIHGAEAVDAVTVNLPGVQENICAPSALDGFGFCNESCEPYPRTGGGGYAGCDDETNTCLPITQRDDEPVEPVGICSDDEGTAAAGESCSNPGFLGGDCADFAVCLSDTADAPTGNCQALCEPFSAEADQCGDGTCSSVPPLLGQLNFSFCLDADDVVAGEAFERCAEDDIGFPCAQDGTLCIDLGSGGQCYPICREGFDDCGDYEGRTCRTGQLNPDVVPGFMGLCQ